MSFANEVRGGLTEARKVLIRRRRQTSDASERAAIDAAISQLNDTVYTMLLLWGHTGQPLVRGRVCHPCGGPEVRQCRGLMPPGRITRVPQALHQEHAGTPV